MAVSASRNVSMRVKRLANGRCTTCVRLDGTDIGRRGTGWGGRQRVGRIRAAGSAFPRRAAHTGRAPPSTQSRHASAGRGWTFPPTKKPSPRNPRQRRRRLRNCMTRTRACARNSTNFGRREGSRRPTDGPRRRGRRFPLSSGTASVQVWSPPTVQVTARDSEALSASLTLPISRTSSPVMTESPSAWEVMLALGAALKVPSF